MFFPDQHLGRNTSVALGLDPERDMLLWDPNKPLGGTTPEEVAGQKRICSGKATARCMRASPTEQIAKARADYPGVR